MSFIEDNYSRFNKFNKEIKDDFEIIEKIGKGRFSIVYKVKNKINNCIYAMKIIEKCPGNQKERQEKELRREIDNLLKCYNVRMCGVVFLVGCIETKEQFKLIFDYCDTNLEEYINENKEKYKGQKMSLDEIKSLFIELNNGFRNLYNNKIIHRDIKINNILIKYRFNDKNDIIPLLADFGISRENSSDENNPMTNSISWALLSAPEILETGTDYSFASDLWSIGVLLYKLAFGKYPFEGKGFLQIYNNIINKEKKLQLSGDENFDDLIKKLLNNNKKKRIKYEDYFEHPFFKYNEPQSIIDFNEKYNLDISSYSKEFNKINYNNGNNLLKDLSIIEFVNLKELILESCNISDLSPLESESFKNLLLLDLQRNKISDLKPLKNIKFLMIKEIYLGFNMINNITILKQINFKQLKVISFAQNLNLIFNDEYKNIINFILKK